jgi:hypothetical protein
VNGDRLPLTYLEATYPHIPWREPLRASTTSGVTGLACRVCIANVGLHGSEIGELPSHEGEFVEHFRRHLHPAEAEVCTCGVMDTPEAREHYGAGLHAPDCPVGRREREAAR